MPQGDHRDRDLSRLQSALDVSGMQGAKQFLDASRFVMTRLRRPFTARLRRQV